MRDSCSNVQEWLKGGAKRPANGGMSSSDRAGVIAIVKIKRYNGVIDQSNLFMSIVWFMCCSITPFLGGGVNVFHWVRLEQTQISEDCHGLFIGEKSLWKNSAQHRKLPSSHLSSWLLLFYSDFKGLSYFFLFLADLAPGNSKSPLKWEKKKIKNSTSTSVAFAFRA